MKLGRALTTAGIAALLLALFETLWVVSIERALPPGYFLLCAGLALAAAGAAGVLCAWAPEPPAWVAAALSGAGAGLVFGAPAGGAVFALLAPLLHFGTRGRAKPLAAGAAAAVGLGVAAIVAPRLLDRVPGLAGLSPEVLDAGLAALLVAIVAGLAIGLARLPRGAARIAVALVALGFLAAGSLPWWIRGPRPAPEPPAPVAATAPLSRPHVLLLVLDTVRADHLTLYGYERETTPRLEAFLAARPRAAVFPSIYADSSWTVPSHASLFTGLPPSQHGAHFGSGSRFDFGIGDHATLAERMRDAGYRTIGLYANPWLGRMAGMERGFDVYRSPFVAQRRPRFGEALRRRLVPGLYAEVFHTVPRARAIAGAIEGELLACGDRPCFVFSNWIDAHSYYVAETCRGKFAPWSARERITRLSIQDPPERTDHLRARYDEELCELDRVLTGLLERLDSEGVLDQSWVFVTSDHGEAFGAHGNTEHGTSAYNDQVWIPLLVLPPAGTALRASPAPGTLVDVAATVAAVGGAAPLGVGRDLRAPAGPEAAAAIEFYGDPAKQETQNPRAADPARAVAAGGLKLVDQSGRVELFDMRVDPHETTDLAAEQPEAVEALRGRLPELRFQEGPGDGYELPPEVRRQLEELGYGD